MKIYNKKGLILGIILAALGVFILISKIVLPEKFLPEQIKEIAIAVLAILMGISGFIRAFSKQLTKEDQIEDSDERNRLLTLKTKSLTLKILYGCLAVSAIGSGAAYKLTANTTWIPVLTVSAILIGFLLLVELVVSICYERRT